MQSSDKPSLLLLSAPPRGGNHLLRGLLDNHPQLLMPPDEDYFVRHLSREPLSRLRGILSSPDNAAAFCRRLQKNGHLERVNAGQASESVGTENSLDLDVYYRYMQEHHRRGSVNTLVRNHVEALAAALGHTRGDGRMRVFFCALQPSNKDLTQVSALLAQSYCVRGVFLIRDPRAHLNSKLIRNPTLNLKKFCKRQNRYCEEIEQFKQLRGPVLKVRFEELVTQTKATMEKVCELAGIDYIPEVLEYTQGGQPSLSNSSFKASQGIDPSTLSRYRRGLSEESLAYVEKHCRPELFWRDEE
ncbi:MAG: hypothetical protein ACI8QT_000294 [Halioglobus sp.]|jgi:hypothetical protein